MKNEIAGHAAARKQRFRARRDAQFLRQRRVCSQTDRFDPKRHQLVFGIGFRFGGRREAEVIAPPPPMVEAAPMAPATQTCADGSVILATDACPVPPPPPVVQPERG